jgi:hypothetical protein
VSCRHALCELIGGACSLATHRSRGCTPGRFEKSIAPEVFDEVRTLLAAIGAATADSRTAAIRLAQIVRREAMDEHNLLAHARDEDPELAEKLAPLLARAMR